MDFNSQLSRMKNLITYGNQVNENARPISTCSLEYRAKAADGKTYGIIREGHRYYIKSASAGQEAIAESYQYLGGFNNKNDYMYDSYGKALKNFELKMASINEACDGKVNIQALNPFRANEVLVEGTKRMKNEIARQRQIMYNAAMLMNEESGIGKAPISSQPESEHANSGDEDTPFTQSVTPDMDFDGKNAECPKSQSEPYGNGGKAPKGKDVQVKDSVAGMHQSGGKVAKVNESIEDAGQHDPSELGELLKNNVVKFTFIKKDGSTRHATGTQNLEIAKKFGAAIPTGVQPERPGVVPFIDLDMKAADMNPDDVSKGRFWKSCREESVESIDKVISAEEALNSGWDEEPEISGEGGEESIAGLPGEGGVDEEFEELDNDMGSEDNEPEYLDTDEIEGEDTDDELQGELDSDPFSDDAKGQAMKDMQDEYGDDFIPMDEEDDDLEDFDDEDGLDGLDGEDDFDDEGDELEPVDSLDDEGELGDEDGLGDEGDELEPEGGEVDETDPESVRAEIERLQSVLDGLEGSEDEEGDEGDEGDEIEPEGEDGLENGAEVDDAEPEGEDSHEDGAEVSDAESEGEDDEEASDEDDSEPMNEAKLAILNRIARRVAAQALLKEETLHDFGKHPGYRKKPIELPETGKDQNEHGKDWNDDSVHKEEPFGQSKGDSKPYSNTFERDALAMKITEKVMENLKKRG